MARIPVEEQLVVYGGFRDQMLPKLADLVAVAWILPTAARTIDTRPQMPMDSLVGIELYTLGDLLFWVGDVEGFRCGVATSEGAAEVVRLLY